MGGRPRPPVSFSLEDQLYLLFSSSEFDEEAGPVAHARMRMAVVCTKLHCLPDAYRGMDRQDVDCLIMAWNAQNKARKDAVPED